MPTTHFNSAENFVRHFGSIVMPFVTDPEHPTPPIDRCVALRTLAGYAPAMSNLARCPENDWVLVGIIPVLHRALIEDPYSPVRFTALRELGTIGAFKNYRDHVLQPIYHRICTEDPSRKGNDPDIRLACVEELEKLGLISLENAEAADPILCDRMVNDEDPKMCLACIKAIVAMRLKYPGSSLTLVQAAQLLDSQKCEPDEEMIAVVRDAIDTAGKRLAERNPDALTHA